MKERPILFSAPMVRALLNSSKTQTRRSIKSLVKYGSITGLQPNETDGYEWLFRNKKMRFVDITNAQLNALCPYGKIGDQLWVRETWRIGAWDEADGKLAIDYCDGPRKAWVTVPGDDDVFEKYWQQSTDDALKGGFTSDENDKFSWEPGKSPCRWRPSIHMPRWASRIQLEITGVCVERLQDISRGDAMAEGCPLPNLAGITDPIGWFRDLWESINGTGSWDANPWVWVIEFKRLKP